MKIKVINCYWLRHKENEMIEALNKGDLYIDEDSGHLLLSSMRYRFGRVEIDGGKNEFKLKQKDIPKLAYMLEEKMEK